VAPRALALSFGVQNVRTYSYNSLEGNSLFLLLNLDVDSMQLDFRPTPAVPALQFFEGVDMQGMAMRAGLRPGDFLLEINGVDVRSASHEQVVELIHQSGDTITVRKRRRGD
jgi:S1-C subfamily serine protease